MPDTTPATGLHTPITNIVPTESTVVASMLSPGSSGFGDAIGTQEGALVETMQGEDQPSARAAGGVDFFVPDLSGLEDIGVASFGAPAQVEAVIGTDERVKITTTKQYPWRLNASLLITGTDNSQWIGTGWFISPRTLITAGHCVFIKRSGVPGRDGWVPAFTSCRRSSASELPFMPTAAIRQIRARAFLPKLSTTWKHGSETNPRNFTYPRLRRGKKCWSDGHDTRACCRSRGSSSAGAAVYLTSAPARVRDIAQRPTRVQYLGRDPRPVHGSRPLRSMGIRPRRC